MSLTQNVDNIGGMGGLGWGGGGGGGLFGGLLLGALLTGRNGGNWLGGGGGDCAGTMAYQAGVNAGSASQYRDVVQATSQINQNVDNQFLTTFGALNAGFERTQAAIADTKDSLQQQTMFQSTQFANVNSGLCNLGHATAAGFAATQNLIGSESCSIKQAIHAEGEQTRALINANTMQNLRDQLNETQRERDLLATGNFPIGRAAQVVYQDPCASRHSGEQITIINQNINALASQVAALASRIGGAPGNSGK